ncbi:hypothetical protein LSTR_LSTR015761 [Laodelphax striatellus]|uniref:Peptidase S8/S53 domain-containing protein n=1 Tax=Laodelphax striatellus TaxID=195883 RepID=A0A482XV85_LAOST|nr:hypothetical protein LSTR_LSTR015761 [Laodelphax striatellus]
MLAAGKICILILAAVALLIWTESVTAQKIPILRLATVALLIWTGSVAAGKIDLHRKVGSTGPVNVDGSWTFGRASWKDWRAAHQNYGRTTVERDIFVFHQSILHVFNDSLWKNQWYLDNYDPDISTDFIDNDRDPMPRYGADSDNSHGTRCAGEIAMVANNSFCGVGVAYNARVGGIKLLDGPTTDLVEGRALIFALDKVDLYSSSWGPPDNGMVIEAPGRMAAKAFEIGANKVYRPNYYYNITFCVVVKVMLC